MNSLYAKKSSCRGCGSQDLLMFLDLGDMPLAGGFLKEEEIKNEIKIPLEVYLCRNCKLVQICHVVDPVKLFKNYFYVSSVIKSLSQHFVEYAQFLKLHYLNFSGAKILEMGCNDGVLLQNFLGDKDIFILGIDASENVSQIARDKGIEVIHDFFNVLSANTILQKYGQFDVLTGSNMFAHIDNIIEIIDGAKLILKQEGVFVFEVHYLLDLLKDFQYDTIYHEHLTYYSVLAIKKIFEQQDMKVIDIIHLDMHGGGIRVVTTRQNSDRAVLASVQEFISSEIAYGLNDENTYLQIGDKILSHKQELTQLLSKIKQDGKKIVGYGAPGRGTILLNYCGIRENYLDYIVDVSPLRKGMLMPGVHLPIVDPQVSRESAPDYFLVLAWNYIDSILEQEELLHKKGTKFIIPFPNIKII